MSKFLIYIGEKQAFDLDQTISAIMSIDGVTNARRGRFIGAVFEGSYSFGGTSTIFRISDDAETVTVEGLGIESADFAIKLQQRMSMPLRAIDVEYSFDICLRDYPSHVELLRAIAT